MVLVTQLNKRNNYQNLLSIHWQLEADGSADPNNGTRIERMMQVPEEPPPTLSPEGEHEEGDGSGFMTEQRNAVQLMAAAGYIRW